MSLTCLNLFTKPWCLKTFNNVLPRQHTIKTLTGESIITLRDETLLGRIMSYLNTKVNNFQNQSTVDGANLINNLLRGGRTNSLKTLSIDQLAGLFYSAHSKTKQPDRHNIVKVLDLLDVECCLRINNMDSENVLKVLNAYMNVIPNRITQYKFYQYATDNFDRFLIQASRKDLLQFIFYIGLQKNSRKAQAMLKKCLRKIDKPMLQNLTIEDLCIICNSTYRTHTKISNKNILHKVKETISNNLYLLKDPALLITFIKTIKHNQYQDDDILNTIKCAIFFNQTSQYYTFAAMCHILALYADNLYYDEDLLKLFIDKCVEELKNPTDFKQKTAYLTDRPKDMTRFLWILSTLGYTNIGEDLIREMIIPTIQRHINAGRYRNCPEELSDSVLYLCMLDYPADELMKYALTPDYISHIRGTQSKNRLNLLLAIVKYQNEKLLTELGIRQMELSDYYQNSQIQARKQLQRVFKMLDSMKHELDITSFEMNMQFQHLNIVGISAYKEGVDGAKPKLAANVEILDDSNCVKNKDCWPTGYMKLKLQILEKSSVPLITIPQSDIATLSEEELQMYLKDEFELIIY